MCFYSCLTGYRLTGGSSVRSCIDSGTLVKWTGSPPTCAGTKTNFATDKKKKHLIESVTSQNISYKIYFHDRRKGNSENEMYFDRRIQLSWIPVSPDESLNCLAIKHSLCSHPNCMLCRNPMSVGIVTARKRLCDVHQ